jgi:hypothetical protein
LARSAKTDEGAGRNDALANFGWTKVVASWNTPHPTELRSATFFPQGEKEERTYSGTYLTAPLAALVAIAA